MRDAEFLLKPLHNTPVKSAYGTRKLNALQVIGIKVGSETLTDPVVKDYHGALSRVARIGEYTAHNLRFLFWQFNNKKRPGYTPLSFAAYASNKVDNVSQKPTRFAVQEAQPTRTLPITLYAIVNGGQGTGRTMEVQHAMAGLGGKEADKSISALEPDGPIVIAQNRDLIKAYGGPDDRFVELGRA